MLVHEGRSFFDWIASVDRDTWDVLFISTKGDNVYMGVLGALFAFVLDKSVTKRWPETVW